MEYNPKPLQINEAKSVVQTLTEILGKHSYNNKHKTFRSLKWAGLTTTQVQRVRKAVGLEKDHLHVTFRQMFRSIDYSIIVRVPLEFTVEKDIPSTLPGSGVAPVGPTDAQKIEIAKKVLKLVKKHQERLPVFMVVAVPKVEGYVLPVNKDKWRKNQKLSDVLTAAIRALDM